MSHTIPAVHALHVADVVARYGVPEQDLLGAIGRTREQLLEPQARLTLPDLEVLVARARALTREPGIGFQVGLQMRASAHGHLGFAAMTASTVREGLELAVRFAPTRTTALSLRLEVSRDEARLVLDERADLGVARDAVLTALLVGIWQIGCALTGRELPGRAEVAIPEPDYFARFAPFVHGRVSFGCTRNRLIFPAALLDEPLQHADPVALRLTSEQLQRDLDLLGAAAPTTPRAAALILHPVHGLRSLPQVAAAMHVSARTLKRRLSEEGTSFSAVRDAEVARAARALLETGATVAEVADRLGYSDPANFTRAFRRLTGTSPRRFRAGE